MDSHNLAHSDFLDIESVLLDNLRFLGFNEKSQDLQLSSGIFSRSNPTAGDKIFYFLFSKLRPKQYERDFEGLWPHYGKAEASQFRKVAHNLIYELENSGSLPKSHSSRSALATCQGERFVKLLWHLSALALRKVYSAIGDISIDPMHHVVQGTGTLKEIANEKIEIISSLRKEFEAEESREKEVLRKWKQLADDITREYFDLKSKLDLYEHQISQLQPFFTSDVIQFTESKMSQVAKNWASLLQFSENCQSLSSGTVEDVMTNKPHRFTIDGAVVTAAIKSSEDGTTRVQDSPLGRVLFTGSSLEGIRGTPEARYDVNSSFVSWDRMFRELRSNLDSPAGATAALLSPRVRWAPEESADLAAIIRRVVDAARQLAPAVESLAKTASDSDSHILSPGNGDKGPSHVKTLRSKTADHGHHLDDVKKLAENIAADLDSVDSAISSLFEATAEADSIPEPSESNSKPHSSHFLTSASTTDPLETMKILPRRPAPQLTGSVSDSLNPGDFVGLDSQLASYDLFPSLAETRQDIDVMQRCRNALIQVASQDWSEEIPVSTPVVQDNDSCYLDPPSSVSPTRQPRTKSRKSLESSIVRVNKLPLMQALNDYGVSPGLLGSSLDADSELNRMYFRQ